MVIFNSYVSSPEGSWKNLPRSIGPCDSWSIPTCWSLATGWALILSWGFRPRRVGIWILISDSFRLFLDLSQSFMTVSHSWPGPCLLCVFMCIIVIDCIHITIIIDRSKGPCEEFSLRRPFMFCWEPLRKFFASSWKCFFCESFAKVRYYESLIVYSLFLSPPAAHPGVRQEKGTAHLPFPL